MNCIGYDLDGVFLSDFFLPSDMSVEEFLKIRAFFPSSIFIPRGKYVIITGRNCTDKPFTEDWIKKNLSSNPPQYLFHECTDFRYAAKYKAEVINKNKIPVFVESDKDQVEFLRKECPTCRIYHFGSLISETLSNL